MLKNTYLVLISKLVLGPGRTQPFAARGTMELEEGTEVYNTIALNF